MHSAAKDRDSASSTTLRSDFVGTRDAGIERAAVIDLDVHQGDGTAEIFGGDANVLTLSLHGKSNFPFRKQQSSIDIAMEDQTGDAEYLLQLAAVLPRVAKHSPEIIFYQAGVDALASDTLGKLALRRKDSRSATGWSLSSRGNQGYR